MSVASKHLAGETRDRPQRLRLVSADVAAKMLSLPLSTMYTHARENSIPGAVRIGRRVLFDLDELEPYVKAGGDRQNGQP